MPQYRRSQACQSDCDALQSDLSAECNPRAKSWLATDVYRKYEQRRIRKSPEYGSPAFKERAQRWYVGERLRSMLKSRFARTDGERYFVGVRLPKVAVICPAGGGIS